MTASRSRRRRALLLIAGAAAATVAILAIPGGKDDDETQGVGGGPATSAWIEMPAGDQAGASTVKQGRTARVQRRAARKAPAGSEAGLPRDGAYARGIELDAAGRHGEALRSYDDALTELDGLAEVAGASVEDLERWERKIQWQRDQSEVLLEQSAYVAVMPTSVPARFHLATAYHAKFLSTRAFLGKGSRLLWDAGVAAYKDALALDGRHAASRAGLAALYAEADLLAEARREFARVGRHANDEEIARYVAVYHAAVGDREQAFTYLRRAVGADTELELHRWIADSNDFDGLRDDRRFAELTTSPDEE